MYKFKKLSQPTFLTLKWHQSMILHHASLGFIHTDSGINSCALLIFTKQMESNINNTINGFDPSCDTSDRYKIATKNSNRIIPVFTILKLSTVFHNKFSRPNAKDSSSDKISRFGKCLLKISNEARKELQELQLPIPDYLKLFNGIKHPVVVKLLM